MDVRNAVVLDHEEGRYMLMAHRMREHIIVPVSYSSRLSGFSLIELMVTISIVAILLAVGVPSLGQWIRSGSVNAMGESVQNGLRRAQVEAVSRNVPVEFALVAGVPSPANFEVGDLVAADDQINWVVRTVENGTEMFVQGGVGASIAPDVDIDGPARIFFAGFGRAQDKDGVLLGATQVFRVTHPDSDRVMCVYVTQGGAIKMCNPNVPDGKPGACEPQLPASACAGSP